MREFPGQIGAGERQLAGSAASAARRGGGPGRRRTRRERSPRRRSRTTGPAAAPAPSSARRRGRIIASRAPATAAARSAGSHTRKTQRAFGSDGTAMITRSATSSRNCTTSGIDIIAGPGSWKPAQPVPQGDRERRRDVDGEGEPDVDREHHAVRAAAEERAQREPADRAGERPADQPRQPAARARFVRARPAAAPGGTLRAPAATDGCSWRRRAPAPARLRRASAESRRGRARRLHVPADPASCS